MAGSAPSRPLPSLNYLLGQLQTSYHYLSIKTFIPYCLAFKIPTPKHNLATATNISSPLPTVWTINYSLPHRGFDLTSHHKQPLLPTSKPNLPIPTQISPPRWSFLWPLETSAILLLSYLPETFPYTSHIVFIIYCFPQLAVVWCEYITFVWIGTVFCDRTPTTTQKFSNKLSLLTYLVQWEGLLRNWVLCATTAQLGNWFLILWRYKCVLYFSVSLENHHYVYHCIPTHTYWFAEITNCSFNL